MLCSDTLENANLKYELYLVFDCPTASKGMPLELYIAKNSGNPVLYLLNESCLLFARCWNATLRTKKEWIRKLQLLIKIVETSAIKGDQTDL